VIEGDGLLEPGMVFRNAVSHTGERQAWGGKGIGGEFKQEILRRLEVDGPLKVYNDLCDKYGQSGTDVDPEKYARIPDEKTIADTGAYHSSSGKNLSNGAEIKNLAEMRAFTHDKMLATKARVESRSYDRTVHPLRCRTVITIVVTVVKYLWRDTDDMILRLVQSVR
jgi:hypothetical protein